jgi:hypothetical protein
MDLDNGANLISRVIAATIFNFVANVSFKKVFLCEKGSQAKDIINKLNSGDDSIFDSDVKVAWADNDNDN